MRVEKFNASKEGKVSNLIQEKFPMMSYGSIQKLFRNKDVKINGKRVAHDEFVFCLDEISFYVSDEMLKNSRLNIVFEDENIVVVFKPRNLETVSMSGDECLQSLLMLQLGNEVFAVHRLDRNTQGLVVFAKNVEAKSQLDDAIKNRYIEKYYLAEVYGRLSKKSDNMIAFLKKDASRSLVQISNIEKHGFDKIQTNYKVLKENENSSIVEVELVTGKTHQIRAHFAHIGHFLIGDEKYGDAKINKLFKKRYQCLCAYRLVFHFKNGLLSYLDNKEIVLDKNKIDFCQNL